MGCLMAHGTDQSDEAVGVGFVDFPVTQRFTRRSKFVPRRNDGHVQPLDHGNVGVAHGRAQSDFGGGEVSTGRQANGAFLEVFALLSHEPGADGGVEGDLALSHVTAFDGEDGVGPGWHRSPGHDADSMAWLERNHVLVGGGRNGALNRERGGYRWNVGLAHGEAVHG